MSCCALSGLFQSVPRASGHLGEGVDTWEMGWTAGRGDEGKKSGVAGTVVIRGLFKTKYMSISYI